MLWAHNSTPQTLAENDMVSFDTVICETNHHVALDNNAVLIKTPGWYEISIYAVVSNASTSSSAQSGLMLIADGNDVEGSYTSFVVPASGSVPVSISIPVFVKPANEGTATIGWQATEQETINTATIKVERKV